MTEQEPTISNSTEAQPENSVELGIDSNVESESQPERTVEQNQQMFEAARDFNQRVSELVLSNPDIGIEEIKSQVGAPSEGAVLGFIVNGLLAQESQATGFPAYYQLEGSSPDMHKRINRYFDVAASRLEKAKAIEESQGYNDATEDEKQEIVEKLKRETDRIYEKEVSMGVARAAFPELNYPTE